MSSFFHSPFRSSSRSSVRSSLRSQKGFTLIEVMVALAIIAIALASLIKASGSHTRSASYLKSKTLAHYVALNEIAKIQVKRKWPSIGTKKKSSEMAGIEWFWISEVGKTRSDDIRSIKFNIYQDEQRTRSLAQAQAFIANPALTNAASPNVNSSANNTGNNSGNNSRNSSGSNNRGSK